MTSPDHIIVVYSIYYCLIYLCNTLSLRARLIKHLIKTEIHQLLGSEIMLVPSKLLARHTICTTCKLIATNHFQWYYLPCMCFLM
jgi:hypothetical protein